MTEQRARGQHGGNGGSYARGCRCPQCTTAHRDRQTRRRNELRNQRVNVDGRLVAPLPPDQHGLYSTYINWSCRCLRCTAANADQTARRRADLSARRRASQ